MLATSRATLLGGKRSDKHHRYLVWREKAQARDLGGKALVADRLVVCDSVYRGLDHKYFINSAILVFLWLFTTNG